jgi:hypothetical protein
MHRSTASRPIALFRVYPIERSEARLMASFSAEQST